MKKNHPIFYILLLTLLSFGTYYKVLDFAFWRDDWAFFWGAIQGDRTFLTLLFHPGTVIEFSVLSRMVGQNTVFWNAFGITLKIIASLAVYTCIAALSRSEKIGKISGVLFSVIPVGLEAIGWAAAHVVLLDVVLVCFAFAHFIEYRRTRYRSNLIAFLLFAFFSFASDPIRTSPLPCMIFLWLVLFEKKKQRVGLRSIGVSLGIAILCIAAAIYVSRNMLGDYLVVRTVKKHGFDLLFYFQKTVLATQNYFSSIGNIFIGSFVPTVNDIRLSSSHQHVISGIVGFFIFLGTLSMNSLRRKKKEISVVLFLLLWILLFYLPNWIFTLQLTVGYTNRYAVVSSVGLVGLIGYGISRISSRWLRIILLSSLVVFFWLQNQHILFIHQQFRSRSVHNQLYERMQIDVPMPSKQYLLMITGDHPALAYSLGYNMQMPLVVARNIPERSQFPIFVDTVDRAVSYICGKTTTHTAAWQFIPVPKPPEIQDVFAWNVQSDGIVESIHEKVRAQIQQKIHSFGCDQIKPLKPL